MGYPTGLSASCVDGGKASVCLMLRCVTREDKITRGLCVAGSAGFHLRLGARFAIWGEAPEAPAARRCILFRVLDLELNVGGRAGNVRLHAAKDLVVLRRRGVAVVQRGDDGAVGIGELSFAVCLDHYVVAQHGTETV